MTTQDSGASFSPEGAAQTTVHPTAIVAEGARLAEGVVVGPYCVVGPHVTIGAKTVLRSHVSIEGHTTLGAGNQLFPFCSVGAPPQDLKYRGEPTLLVIGDNNVIRESVTLQPGTIQGGGVTRIGHRNLFMAYTHVAHDCIVGDENILANGVQLSGHVTLENQTVLGGLSAVHQFCRIGDLGMLGGGSMVVQDVPPFATVQGNHATFRGLNLVGLKRRGFSSASIATIKKVYRAMITNPSATVEESALLAMASMGDSDDVALATRIIEFIQSSGRGVVRPSKQRHERREERDES
jgi:UDP-N-acetylglucosamine acyltransferase